MRKLLTTLMLLAPLGAGSAVARDDCSVPMADWQPRHAVERMAEAQGWSVRRIKIDDGCYEVDGRDAEGRAIEVTLDPATLAIIEVEYDEGGGGDNNHALPGDAVETEADR
jgi:hypothetical protein